VLNMRLDFMLSLRGRRHWSMLCHKLLCVPNWELAVNRPYNPFALQALVLDLPVE